MGKMDGWVWKSGEALLKGIYACCHMNVHSSVYVGIRFICQAESTICGKKSSDFELNSEKFSFFSAFFVDFPENSSRIKLSLVLHINCYFFCKDS